MTSNTDSSVNDWIKCPDCGSDDATLTIYARDRDGNLHCPDCDSRIWEVPYRAEPQHDAYR
jgi:DNA-directed RNA polymerase subunit RPC12/RpoP